MRNIRTDKISHGYLQVYDPLFMSLDSISNVLEIGVYNGDSLRLLQNYFPNSNIYGFDLTPPRDHHYNDRFKVLLGNQEDRDDLNHIFNSIGGDLDLIIDDGGHTMKQQQTSFGFLFRHLKSGGVYILEDLHTSRYGLNSEYINKDDLITTLDMLQNFKNTNNIISNHMLDHEIKYLEENIESIEIWSKNIEHNISVTSIIKKIK
ncbi:MAG: class I SAM-dependent methyltransferase [Chitinophagaceae bacterium]|nr:class I SAM-dependent methyltransferase [Chitinophagaceae bacterium]